MTYRVVRWSEIYERNRTRDMAAMRWIALPVNLSGDGYTLTVERPDGAALYGVFVAILQVAASSPERGVLVRSNGKPHDAESLRRKTRLPAELIDAALEWFASDEIRWLEVVDAGPETGSPDSTADACGEPAEKVSDACGEPAANLRGTCAATRNSTLQATAHKKKHRDSVLLTENEYQRLVNAHGEWFVEQCIDKLDAWKGAKGKKVKSDYKAILNWVVGAVREDIGKGRILQPEKGGVVNGKYAKTGSDV